MRGQLTLRLLVPTLFVHPFQLFHKVAKLFLLQYEVNFGRALNNTIQHHKERMATMASTYKKDGGHSGPPPRKKVKTSELPLASATRAAIEGLAHTYKKKGTYDELRTKIWQELEKGVCISKSFRRAFAPRDFWG